MSVSLGLCRSSSATMSLTWAAAGSELVGVFLVPGSSATEAETGRPLGRAASDPPESTRSADVRDPFLRPRLGGGSCLSGKLKHCCCLTFRQVRQKLNVPVGKF